MGKLVIITTRLVQAGQRAYERKWNFLGFFALVFIGSATLLAQFDLLPSVAVKVPSVAKAMEGKEASVGVNTASQTVPELPLKIEIAVINLSATVANPTTTDVATLDEELLKGAVRYPTSAKLGEKGNVVLFGHSSYLPIVGNQAYKTFNGIQKLSAGDKIVVSSSGTVYTYAVKSMTKKSAENAAIPLLVTGKVLTLSTCNSFAEKADRFVVVADFVESHGI
jgi:LPXTG-site transpeptidase (sortase) family protein